MHVLLLALCCTIGGSVHATSGVPLASALIELRGVAGTEVRRGATDVAGNFSLPAVPGRYRLAASARGYASVIVAVDAQNDVRVELSLEALDSPRLRIGLVTVDGRLAPVRGAVPALTLTRADFDALGEDRVVDGLRRLPGATFARPDGGAASAASVAHCAAPILRNR